MRASIPYVLAGLAAISANSKRAFNDLTSRRPDPTIIQQELGPLLSRNASLSFPYSQDFASLTRRWATNTESDFAVVVVPGVDRDVAAAVRYANERGMPFLAFNRGHGSAAGLSAVDGGLSIYIRALDSIEISEDGRSAVMGGGVFQDQAINYLAKRGKVATSGACACTGMLGPGLGGGFGRYQGLYGLVLDSILEMDVVLANGSLITVSADSHSDLFWGMRGAGHNFGIVTRFRQRIYDDPIPEWYFATLTYGGDKLEAVFEALNAFGANGTLPKEATTYTLYNLVPAISTTEPVVIFTLEYGGSAANAAPILAPFFALGPLNATNATVPYTAAAHAGGAGLQDAICQKGGSHKLYTTNILAYNTTTNRVIYDLFSQMVSDNPAFANSTVQFEGYPQQGVRAVDPDSTAYAHRYDNLLVSFDPIWPSDQPDLESIADTYGYDARNIFHAGEQPGRTLNAYVNYASSDETLEMLYGYEPWRLQRLRELKMTYDPDGRFNFYNPIR